MAFATDKPTALYRFFDKEDRPLYIGITVNPEERWAMHALTEWWPLAVRHTLTWFDDRSEAATAEVAAIKAERPTYNRAHADYREVEGVPVKELRAKLADVLNDASVYGQVTHVTSRGRRVGVVVGEQLYEQAKADRAVVEALRMESPDLYAKLTS